MCETYLFHVFQAIATFIGTVGIFVIAVGVVRALVKFLQRKSFWEIRVLIVKHILLGLDFLIARDIIETVVIKSNTALWIDLISLILIIAVRVIFSFFAEKEMDELMEEHLQKRALKAEQKGRKGSNE